MEEGVGARKIFLSKIISFSIKSTYNYTLLYR